MGREDVVESLTDLRRRRVERTGRLHKMLLGCTCWSTQGRKGKQNCICIVRTAGLFRVFMVQSETGYSQSLVRNIRQKPLAYTWPHPRRHGQSHTHIRSLVEPSR